jgi:hypothetical protein
VFLLPVEQRKERHARDCRGPSYAPRRSVFEGTPYAG